MSQIPWLDSADLAFPDPASALDEPNGLLAAGGDLSQARLLLAYRHGIFPWFEQGQPLLWWSPHPRAVFLPDQIHISRSLRRSLRRRDWSVTTDTAFDAVIDACAKISQDRTGTWITAEMRDAYCALHRAGWAHSVEVWEQGELTGGLYGIGMGRLFFGESMFSRAADASKIALVVLGEQLSARGYRLIDCQVGNGHLYRMGAIDIDRARFLDLLDEELGDESAQPERWDWRYTRDQWCNKAHEDQSV